jgi:hypothetical protein
MKRSGEPIGQSLQTWCSIDRGLCNLSLSLTSAGVTDARDVIMSARQSLAHLMDSIQDDIYARSLVPAQADTAGLHRSRPASPGYRTGNNQERLVLVKNGS